MSAKADPSSGPKRSPAARRLGGGGRLLDLVEWMGNRLPDPTVLFVWCTVIVVAVSALGAWGNWRVQPVRLTVLTAPATDSAGRPALDPASGKPVQAPLLDSAGRPRTELRPEGDPIAARSLLTSEGIYWALSTMVKNFVEFPPLGVVLVAVLGVGVAERTGFIGTMLRAFVLVVPRKLLTPAVIFVGVNSSMAADAGYLVLPPLAAALYRTVGRSPLVGIAAVFAGVAGGFSANLLITSLDPLLSGLTEKGARIIEPGYVVNPACNWWFMIGSTFLLTFLGWAVTSWIVEPRLSRRPADEGGPSPLTAVEIDGERMTPTQWRALWLALVTAVLGTGLIIASAAIPGWPLYTGAGPDGRPEAARWVVVIVPIIFFLFLVPGMVYGRAAGTLRSSGDATRLMSESIASLAPVLVMAFVAAQFIAYFRYSNLDRMLAFACGGWLAASGVSSSLLLVAIIALTMFFNLFIGSASAKWSMMAPIFVPMFMLVGISPELTQAAYRVGDSITNVITPLNAYLVIILAVMQRFAPRAKMGTLLSMMLPYSMVFAVFWTALLLAWAASGFPIGDGGRLTYVPAH